MKTFKGLNQSSILQGNNLGWVDNSLQGYFLARSCARLALYEVTQMWSELKTFHISAIIS